MTTSYKQTQMPEEQQQASQPVPPMRLPSLGKAGFGVNTPGNGSGLLQRARQTVRSQTPPTQEENNLVLYKTRDFFLRTAYRVGQNANPLRRSKGLLATQPKVMPQQERRIANSETRLMPAIAPINPINKQGHIPVPLWLETLVIVLGLLATGIAHALNMFNFPRYELDEGTYMASASAILHGQLWPYAYGYGHPPIAWMQIAAWIELTGGFFTFGNALNSGRVLMLVYALGCSLLVYLIVRRFGASRSAALLAMLIFSLSPLSITYQRQVLLDNVATFWLLLSLYLLVVGNSRLKYVVLSALALGIAFLSKEVFILFMPAMIYAVWLHTTQFQRKFALVAFTYTIVAVGSSFLLLAVLKGELFPSGWLPWDHSDHLSLLGTLIGQTKRTQTEGSFASSFSNWLYGDNVVIIGSSIATAFNLLMGWRNRKHLLVALLALSFWLLLIRGGVVLSFYLIPLIPLLAINIAMAVHTIMNWVGKRVRFDAVRVVLILGVIAAIIPYDVLRSGIIFTQHPTSAQTEAITWVRQHVPHNDFIVINSYLYMDLRESNGAGVGDGATYPYAHVYQNVASDPAIKDVLLAKNWDRIDYIVADSEMLNDIRADKATFQIIDDALNASILRAEFRAKDHDHDLVIQVFEVKHKFSQPVVGIQGWQGVKGVRDV